MRTARIVSAARVGITNSMRTANARMGAEGVRLKGPPT
jgi:hypothetical protein